jgi:hypothetical protein
MREGSEEERVTRGSECEVGCCKTWAGLERRIEGGADVEDCSRSRCCCR